MSKLKVDEIRQSTRSVSASANITLANDGKTNLAENLVIANGKGIDFSAVSGSASGSENALFDDYEEGTWVPQLTEGSYNYTMHSDNGGRYVKIGSMVMVSGMCRPNDNVHSNGNYNLQAKISGLPFASANGTRNSAGLAIGYFNYYDTSISSSYLYVPNNSSVLELYKNAGSSNLDILKITEFNGNTSTANYYLYFSGVYYTG